MKNNLSKILSINSKDISIKATTADKLGAVDERRNFPGPIDDDDCRLPILILPLRSF